MAELKYGWLATPYPRIKTLDKKRYNLVMSVAVDPENAHAKTCILAVLLTEYRQLDSEVIDIKDFEI